MEYFAYEVKNRHRAGWRREQRDGIMRTMEGRAAREERRG